MKMKKLLALAAITTLAAASIAAVCDDEDSIADPTAVPTYATKIEDAPIDGLDVLTLESFPPQYNLVVTSGLPSGCAVFDKAEISGRGGNTITVRVTNIMPDDPNVVCTAIYGIKETTVGLGSDFTSGQTYTVNVNDQAIDFTAQ
jgi:hypothetical protein